MQRNISPISLLQFSAMRVAIAVVQPRLFFSPGNKPIRTFTINQLFSPVTSYDYYLSIPRPAPICYVQTWNLTREIAHPYHPRPIASIFSSSLVVCLSVWKQPIPTTFLVATVFFFFWIKNKSILVYRIRFFFLSLIIIQSEINNTWRIRDSTYRVPSNCVITTNEVG